MPGLSGQRVGGFFFVFESRVAVRSSCVLDDLDTRCAMRDARCEDGVPVSGCGAVAEQASMFGYRRF